MNITLEYRNATPSHCDIAVFINGALSGTLCVRQDEILPFQMIICNGMIDGMDSFLGRGNPDPVESAL
jgi:hypothetical protein